MIRTYKFRIYPKKLLKGEIQNLTGPYFFYLQNAQR